MNVKMSALVAALVLSGASAQAQDISRFLGLKSSSQKDSYSEAPRARRVPVAPLTPRSKVRQEINNTEEPETNEVAAVRAKWASKRSSLQSKLNALNKQVEDKEKDERAKRTAKENSELLAAVIAGLSKLDRNGLERFSSALETFSKPAAAPTRDAHESKSSFVATTRKNYESSPSASLSTSITSRSVSTTTEKEVETTSEEATTV